MKLRSFFFLLLLPLQFMCVASNPLDPLDPDSILTNALSSMGDANNDFELKSCPSDDENFGDLEDLGANQAQNMQSISGIPPIYMIPPSTDNIRRRWGELSIPRRTMVVTNAFMEIVYPAMVIACRDSPSLALNAFYASCILDGTRTLFCIAMNSPQEGFCQRLTRYTTLPCFGIISSLGIWDYYNFLLTAPEDHYVSFGWTGAMFTSIMSVVMYAALVNAP